MALDQLFDETLHQQYLDAFYEEEFDNEDPLKATQRRPMIPRKRIRAYQVPASQDEETGVRSAHVLRDFAGRQLSGG